MAITYSSIVLNPKPCARPLRLLQPRASRGGETFGLRALERLGSSRVVISGVISHLKGAKRIVSQLTILLITTHEPSRSGALGLQCSYTYSDPTRRGSVLCGNAQPTSTLESLILAPYSFFLLLDSSRLLAWPETLNPKPYNPKP